MTSNGRKLLLLLFYFTAKYWLYSFECGTGKMNPEGFMKKPVPFDIQCFTINKIYDDGFV